MLRIGLEGDVEPDLLVSERVALKPERLEQRFEHYAVLQSEDGKLIELGRGSMGVTYKAIDIHLQCPVTLKVINEKYLRNKSARTRFLREARMAASLRHPNVASVFYLGRSGVDYFYAMEFVEGETLEKLIHRSARLAVKLALEIATQVAAGLAAVHRQNLVHRDIKPSNVMVNFEERGAVTVKIIDLGLAKAVNEPISEAALSMPGAFTGTPELIEANRVVTHEDVLKMPPAPSYQVPGKPQNSLGPEKVSSPGFRSPEEKFLVARKRLLF